MAINVTPSLPTPSVSTPDPLAENQNPTFVESFNSRVGAVFPATGDYASSMIANDGVVTGVTVNDALAYLNTKVGGGLLTENYLPMADASGNLVDSNISDTGSMITISSNVTITGTVLASGGTTLIDSTVVAIGDSMMKYAKDNTSSDVVDIGWYGAYGPTPSYSGMFRDASDGKFKLFSGLTVEPTTTVDTVGAGYAAGTLVVGTLEATSVTGADLVTGASNLTTQYRMAYVSAAGTLTESSSIVTDASGNLSVTGRLTQTQSATDISLRLANTTGQDWDFYSYNNGDLYVNNAAGTIMTLTSTATANLITGTANLVTIGGAFACGSLTSTGIDDNATTTALTLDSSQNATFAGSITSSAAVSGAQYTTITNTSTSTSAVAGLYVTNNTPVGAAYQVFGSNNTSTWDGISLASYARLRTDSGVAGLIITTSSTDDLILGAGDATALTLDGTTQNATFAGNVGLGGAPSANHGNNTLVVRDQSGTVESVTIGARTAQYGDIGYGFGFNGSAYKYLINDYASRIFFDAGGFRFYTAPSGTAGNAITFTEALHIDNSQNATFAGDVISTLWFRSPNTKGLLVQNNSAAYKIGVQLDSSNVWQIGETHAIDFQGGNFSLDTGGNVLIGTATQVGTALLTVNADVYAGGFYDCATAKGLKVNGTQVVTDQQTALTSALTSITHTAPGTPDYALQDMTNTSPYGFVTQDEANTTLSVIANLQTRVNELETKLQAHGLIA